MADKPKVNLRFKPKGAEALPVQPLEVDRPGMRGTLPFAAGGAITRDGTERVPESVRQVGRQIMEAPAEIPEDVKRRANQLMSSQPEVVNIRDLPREKQEEILASVAAAARMPAPPAAQPQPQPRQQQQPQQRAPEPPKFMPAGPGIGQAKAMADRMAAEQEARWQRDEQARQQQAQQPNLRLVEPPRAPEPPPQAPEQAPEPPEQQSGPVTPVNCVHCGWPTDRMDMCDPTMLDKQVFVAAILGQKRWSKEYELLGGRMKVMFRSLTVEENDLVVKQLMKDWNDGKISGPAHSVVEATKYQLAMALESVGTSVGPITLPELSDYEAEPPADGATILPQVVEYVNEKVMQNEPTRRIIAKAYGHFIDTQAKLEAMAEQPDFWSATGV